MSNTIDPQNDAVFIQLPSGAWTTDLTALGLNVLDVDEMAGTRATPTPRTPGTAVKLTGIHSGNAEFTTDWEDAVKELWFCAGKNLGAKIRRYKGTGKRGAKPVAHDSSVGNDWFDESSVFMPSRFSVEEDQDTEVFSISGLLTSRVSRDNLP